jgi:hypothetical protein
MAHHFIRDSWATALQPALALAGHISNSTKLDIERPNITTVDISARPFDISFEPTLHATNCDFNPSPFSIVGTDVTITHSHEHSTPPLSADVKQQLTAIADRHLQVAEKKKFMRDKVHINPNTDSHQTILGDTVIKDLLDKNWGPITQAFLSNPTPLTLPLQFPPSRPNAQTMYIRATTHPAPLRILNSADEQWKLTQTRRFYGYSHTTPTPQIHTIQQLGLGITKAFSQHLRRSIKLATNNTTNPTQDHEEDDNLSTISNISTT